ncbi:UNVERIFIED_CONTAM: hypothetical protein HDU68_000445 [Siphonaria sp. JEL0065]|nr:hypothetical protein HDU68_000445 [Siphonaria sp. JEL0065]
MDLSLLPYEILAKILRILTVQRRAAVFSLCRRLYNSESLKAEYIYRERPLRFEFIAALGKSAQLESHVRQTVDRIECCECANTCNRLSNLTNYLRPSLYAVAAQYGNLDFMFCLRSTLPKLSLSPTTMDLAAQGGHLHILQSIVRRDPKLNLQHDQTWRSFTNGSALCNAAESGHLHVVEWILENNLVVAAESLKTVIRRSIDAASVSGNLDVVEYLVSIWKQRKLWENDNEESTNDKENSRMPCTIKALNLASKHGHLPVVQYLHKTLNAPATKDAMDHAAGHGHLEIVQFLHKHRFEGCTAKAMDFACLRNHLAVVKWLHENRKEGCTAEALNYAASRGNVKVCQFLIKCRREGRVSDAIRLAKKAGHMGLVGFLSDSEKRRDTQSGKGRR